MPYRREVNDDKLTEEIIGAAIDVHTSAGPDFAESIYRDMLRDDLHDRDIECRVEHEIDIERNGKIYGQRRVDLFVEDEVVVELKVLKQLKSKHLRQLGANVKLSSGSRGLLLNFGSPRLGIQRFSTKEWLRRKTDG